MKRILRGDAPTAKKIQRIKTPLVEGAVTLRIGNKSLVFEAWSASVIAAAWNASLHAEFREAIASTSGDDLLLTARTAGVPFFVIITVGAAVPGEGRNEVQIITLINGASGGTWNVEFDGDDADVAWNITGANLQTALEGLDTLAVGDVTVTGSAGGPWTVTFGGRFSAENVPDLVVDGANLTGGDAFAAIATVQDGGGSSDPATLDADPSSGPAGVHAGSLRVWDDPSMSGSNVWFHLDLSGGREGNPGAMASRHGVIRFPLDLERGANLTDAELSLQYAAVGGSVTVRVYAEAADDADYPTSGATVASILARPLTTEFVEINITGTGDGVVISGLEPVIAEVINRPGWVSGNHIQFHLRVVSGSFITFVSDDEGGSTPDNPLLHIEFTEELREIQTVELVGSNIRGGAVTLTLDGEALDPLDWDATAAEAQAAAEANANVGAGNVVCTGGPWPAPIQFSFDSSLGNLPQMTATDTLINGDVQVLTTQQGGVSVEIVEDQRSRGPNHFDDPLNWQDETGAFGVPQRNDRVYCPDNKADLLYGLCQRSNFTAVAATDRLFIADPQIAFWEGQTIEVKNTGGALPGGLSADTTYFVRDLDPSGPSLRLSTTLNGVPVAISGAGTGTHEIGVRLEWFETDARYTGKLGLPRVNKDGKYQEYRTRFLKAWIDDVRIGRGDGSGSQRCHLDTGASATTLQLQTSQGAAEGAPAVQWLGTGTGNMLEILGGNFGVAIDPEQTAEFDSLLMRNGQVLIGRDVAVGDIERTGGTLRMLGATVDGNVTL